MQDAATRQQEVVTYIAQVARTSMRDSCKLRRFLWRYERAASDVEDIIQDAMVEALRCSDRFLARSSVETWFFGVAANVARNHVARRVTQASRTESLDLLREVTGDPAGDRRLGGDAEVGSRDDVAIRQFAGQVSNALARLPDDLRDTFELVCLQERSYRDVAEMLSIPIGTIRSRIHRARSLLRLMLGENAAEGVL